MSENAAELLIELSLEGSDSTELDELTRQLRAEVEELNVDSVEQVSVGRPRRDKGRRFRRDRPDGGDSCSHDRSSAF